MLGFVTRRPVAVVMFTLAVLLFGLVSLSRLPVTLLPDLSYPTLTVRTELEGAAPTEIETLLSKPIEEAVGVIKNVRRVTSVSRAGTSDVTLEFNWGTEMDYAVLDVREKLDQLARPQEAPRPLERLKITLADDGQLVIDKGVKFLFEKGQWGKPGSFVKA